ncbi:FAD binding domain-containing protein [Jatrophihabitans telluris]|uniref:FAD binding domain-containing protein n=1 Tax=Jatrophihabitans telluris TaxID=2038343 RepID=A0ABY4QZL4_9ACTN|nr:FAD binding domain-containing protein [Jatrophihabitans telluris]UQX88365.1 FAD binding domain-containing protein [Jatrophihabitans telluris]
MDLPSITEVISIEQRADLPTWSPGDAFLAGGSWLFSEPQPALRRLIDLTRSCWPGLTVSEAGLEISATCTLARLYEAKLPSDWLAAPLFAQCCHALLGSFKVWNTATVGGNVCLALPAGPMTSLTAALDATALIWCPGGGERLVPVADFVTGNRESALAPGELLRSIAVPVDALRSRTAFRQISLTALGRSAALVIGRRQPGTGTTVFTVTASTPAPVQLRYRRLPSARDLLSDLERANVTWFADVHGLPEWRADQSRRLLVEVRDELAAAA